MITGIICGSRNFSDRPLLELMADTLLGNCGQVFSGGAKGADSLGEEWAEKRKKPCQVFNADWGEHGRRAGPIRNSIMVNAAIDLGETIVLAFVQGDSRGTRDCVRKAKAIGASVYLVEWIDGRWSGVWT